MCCICASPPPPPPPPQRAHDSVVKVLLEQGSSVNLCNRDGYASCVVPVWGKLDSTSSPCGTTSCASHLLLLSPLMHTHTHVPRCCALAFAAICGHTSTARLLLEVGFARVDTPDNLGATPLLRAAQSGHADTLALLLRQSASPTATTQVRARVCVLALRADTV